MISRPPHFSRRRAVRPGRSRRGFTLIEIMVAIMVFSMVVAAIYATLMLILRASQIGRTAAERAQRERVTMRTIENSLMCVQSFQASQKYYAFIAEGGDAPLLSFASRVPGGFPRDSKFAGFNLRRLTYTLEPGETGGKNLVLRQTPILMDMDDTEQKYPLILARNVKLFSVECWDTNQMDWVQEWDYTNSIPPLIRVGLVMGRDGGGNSDLSEDSDLNIWRVFAMPSAMMPQAAQMGGGPANAGAPPVQFQLPPAPPPR